MLTLGLLLLFAGLCVVVAELFIPSAGVLGFVATGLIIAAIVVGFFDGLGSGALILSLTVIAVPVLLVIMIRIWPHTPIGKRILLKNLTAEDVMPNDSHYQKTASLKGRLGIAKSVMLPSGQVLIDGEKYDAVSEGFAIEPGDRIRVVAVRQNRIYVEPYDGDDDPDDLSLVDRDPMDRSLEELGIDPLDDPLG